MTNKPIIKDSLLLCASDLQHSAIYDNHIEMQSCIRAVADRITALASVIECVGRAALAAPAQPVAHVSQETFNDDGTSDIIIPALPIGMALYAAPQPAAQAAPTFAAKLPSPANVGTAPKCLNLNDQAMWVLGWNECLDAARAAQKGNKP